MTAGRKRNSKLKYLLFLVFLAMIILFAAQYFSKAMYPVKYREYVLEYSSKFGLDPYLVFAMIKVESDFKPDAVSPKKARGLMQITDKTGAWGAEMLKLEDYAPESLFDPETNINIGCWYMKSLLEQFGNDTDLALAAYNGGSGNVAGWLRDKSLSSTGKSLDRIPFKETENYLKKVGNCRAAYKRLYENGF